VLVALDESMDQEIVEELDEEDSIDQNLNVNPTSNELG